MRRAKYNNKKTTVDGIEFDSKAEARRYGELKLLLRAGAIEDLVLQPVFEIIPAVRWNRKLLRAKKYRADFQYQIRATGRIVVEDVKGVRTAEYILKRQEFLRCYGETHEFIEIAA